MANSDIKDKNVVRRLSTSTDFGIRPQKKHATNAFTELYRIALSRPKHLQHASTLSHHRQGIIAKMKLQAQKRPSHATSAQTSAHFRQ